MINIAILASGNGTNAERIIKYFQKSENIKVKMVLNNNPRAYVLDRAQKHEVDTRVFSRTDFNTPDKCLQLFENTDFIVLAGFLWLIPQFLVKKFENKIINIHPALLPSYGGKGMYGDYVHEAVLRNKENFSGITIHLVNEHYDEGQILFQKKIKIDENESPWSLAEKIHALEHLHYPKVIEETIEKSF